MGSAGSFLGWPSVAVEVELLDPGHNHPLEQIVVVLGSSLPARDQERKEQIQHYVDSRV